MIVDELKNAHLYRGLSARIGRAFDYLCNTDLVALEPGNYEIDETMHARVLAYPSRTPDKGVWEAHRQFLDLQSRAARRRLEVVVRPDLARPRGSIERQ